MPIQQASFFCPHCNQMRLFQQVTMSHTPHLLASIFLCGLWLPIWLIMALTENPPWRCSQCGFTDQTKYLANPTLREQEARNPHPGWKIPKMAGKSNSPEWKIAIVIGVIVIAVLILAGLVALSSNIARRQVVDTSTAWPISNANVQTSKRAKLIIQQEKNGTETGVYQQKLRLAAPIKVNGKPVGGDHRIEISSTANFPTNKPSCSPGKTSMIILHEKPKKDGWQFPSKIKIVWVIDGQKTSPTRILQDPIELENSTWWESLITEPDCETLKQLTSAKDAELRLNDAVIKLSSEEIATLKEFTRTLGF